MAVDAVASVILEKLKDLLLEESFTNNKVISNQLTEMQEALEKMRGFFIDAAEKEENAEAIKKWTDGYLDKLYYVEDSIESFALRITRERKRLGFLMNHALFLKRFTACKMLSRKLDRIQKRFDKLNNHTPAGLEDGSLRSNRSRQDAENHDDKQEDEAKEPDSTFSEENGDKISSMRQIPCTSKVIATEGGPSPRSPLPRSNSYKLLSIRDASLTQERWRQAKLLYSYSYEEEVPSIVGYECEVSGIMKKLECESNRPVVPVVGEMGSGKTTLARAVYGNRKIKKRFHDGFCAWVTVFKETTTMDIFINLLKQMDEKSKEQDDQINEELLKTRLREKLEGHVYLVVLDGIQSFDQWEKLKDAFPYEQNGSMIMLTTCDHTFPADSKSQQPHYLKGLNYEDSWTLFLKKVGIEDFPDSELTIKERIICVCGGLPLNIVLLGSLLSTKTDKWIKNWTSILGNQENMQTSDIFMLSYNDLDDHLKLCLLYMLLFPKELDIPVRRLQRLWLAEGFVKRSPQTQDIQEDVVQGYFDNLVRRSLIMVSKHRSAGSPKKCRLLGVVHDFLSDKARDMGLFHSHTGPTRNEKSPFGKRRLVEYADGEKCQLKPSEYQHLRSYITFNLQKKDIPAKHVGDLLIKVRGKKGFGLLRVLDLEGVYRPSLPENLGDLFHLRYLGLRWTFLDKLPKSVAQLLYLETLDLKRTSINRIPPSIWKLKHLRHLNINEIHLDKDMTLHSRGSLPELLTLWGLTVDRESPIKNGLSKLTHLRELGISLRLSKFDEDKCEGKPFREFEQELIHWISKLTDLQSLRLRSKYDSGYPADLSLEPMSELTKLTQLNLLGKLQKLPERNHFPPNIKVLTLSVSKLEQDPMPILGQLSSLTVLRLLRNSYMGNKIVCPNGSFEALEFLKLWMLKDLKKWELEDGAMKKLKELNIRCCHKLENIPERLWNQETFKDLILTNMDKEKFKHDAEKHDSTVSIVFEEYDTLPQGYGDDAPNEMAFDINGGN